MPFKSEAQRRFLFAKHPQIAERWAHEYPHQGHLPAHVKKKKKRHKRGSAPSLFSRLGLVINHDEHEDCQAAALYAVKQAIWPNQALGAAPASINPGAPTPNPMAGTPAPQAQPLIAADQPAQQAPPAGSSPGSSSTNRFPASFSLVLGAPSCLGCRALVTDGPGTFSGHE